MDYRISSLMQSSGVKFGTSGARGLAVEMTDKVCYSYTLGFLQYLEEVGELSGEGPVAIAGDRRPSTGRIMAAVARAAADKGYAPVNCGRVPSPAVALYGLEQACPSIMVTGSHIPADRNGIKFNKCSGEILKEDEAGITSQVVAVDDGSFGDDGMFLDLSGALPEVDGAAGEAYVRRYLGLFPSNCLSGMRLGIYQHSAVGREMLVEIFAGLGAAVVPLAPSETFVPVDTEAIRDEDVLLARCWAADEGLDAILSTDGDSDRPLISDEQGAWLRGDVLGILAARYLGADSVSTPVSCNSALEKTGWFGDMRRTRIGSPFVVASMMDAVRDGLQGVVGYEANGGFLTHTPFALFGGGLRALPTRDAVLPMLALLLLSLREKVSISGLLAGLPACYTASGRIQDFPTEESAQILARFALGSMAADKVALEEVFGGILGTVKTLDRTDGLRVTFESGEVLHLRPSGNAPEFRCYIEAASPERVAELQAQAMAILLSLKG
jgi:phosphomannomutase